MDASTFLAAVTEGDERAVDEALGSDPSWCRLPDDDGVTPLHLAVRAGRVAIAERLLDAGADIDARTGPEHGRRTPLHDSYECGQPALTQLLLDRGADYDIAVAAALGDAERVDRLLDDRPELVDDDSTGLSPLGWAGYGQDPAMVGRLVERGATLTDELCCPSGTGNTAMIQAFLDAGADANALSTATQARPLHVAVAMPYSSDSTAAVQLLLEAGADPAATAADGTTTPLGLADRRRSACDPSTEADRIGVYDRMIAILTAAVVTGQPDPSDDDRSDTGGRGGGS